MTKAGTRYWEWRAEEELEVAQQSEHPDAVRAHYLLAGLYLDRAYNEQDADASLAAVDRGTATGATGHPAEPALPSSQAELADALDPQAAGLTVPR